jgi:hypothetical protein
VFVVVGQDVRTNAADTVAVPLRFRYKRSAGVHKINKNKGLY